MNRCSGARPSFFDEEMKAALLSSDTVRSNNTIDLVRKYLAEYERHADGDFLSRMIYLELKLRLPELLLMRVDKVTMANSIETRVPFLDHHLVEFAGVDPE